MAIMLVNTSNQSIIAIIDENNKLKICDPTIKNLLEQKGINIPDFLRHSFSKSNISSKDKDFARAFKEVYWQYTIKDHKTYRWREAIKKNSASSSQKTVERALKHFEKPIKPK